LKDEQDEPIYRMVVVERDVFILSSIVTWKHEKLVKEKKCPKRLFRWCYIFLKWKSKG